MLDQNIMHRDISINNIMIASSGTGGYLIDLDFAVLLSRDSISGAPHRTGTVEFMAIEVLEGLPHAPRHDLESFLYVLIWMFTKFPAPGDDSLKPDGGICEVDLWGNGSFRYISGIKSKLRDAQYSNLNSVYYSQFYPGWKKRSTSKLVIKWWGLLFNKKDPLDMTPEDRMLLEMSAGVVKPVRSLESLREEGLELSKKMIEALDKALEEVMQEDAEEVK